MNFYRNFANKGHLEYRLLLISENMRVIIGRPVCYLGRPGSTAVRPTTGEGSVLPGGAGSTTVRPKTGEGSVLPGGAGSTTVRPETGEGSVLPGGAGSTTVRPETGDPSALTVTQIHA